MYLIKVQSQTLWFLAHKLPKKHSQRGKEISQEQNEETETAHQHLAS